MSSGERPLGAAKGKQSDTEALCHPPPPPLLSKLSLQSTSAGAVCQRFHLHFRFAELHSSIRCHTAGVSLSWFLAIARMHGVRVLSGLVTRNLFLTPCCMHADNVPKNRHAVGSRIVFSTVCFSNAHTHTHTHTHTCTRTHTHTQTRTHTPLCVTALFHSFWKLCAFDWLQSSSSWEVAVLLGQFSKGSTYIFARLIFIRSYPLPMCTPPPPIPPGSHQSGVQARGPTESPGDTQQGS